MDRKEEFYSVLILITALSGTCCPALLIGLYVIPSNWFYRLKLPPSEVPSPSTALRGGNNSETFTELEIFSNVIYHAQWGQGYTTDTHYY